jgi:mono/diheme cytochrome c family protein
LSDIMRTITAIAILTAVGATAPLAQQPQMPRGDAARGKALYEANKCADCHRLGEIGSRVARISPVSATPGHPNSCTGRSSRQTTR